MSVIAWTMHPDPALGFCLWILRNCCGTVTWSVCISGCLAETMGFLGERQLDLMKRSTILINTARGAIVKETALVDALQSRRIAGAGLDVFETEPLPAGHPLTQLDNVVLTPHCAGVVPEVLEAGLALAIANVEISCRSPARTSLCRARAKRRRCPADAVRRWRALRHASSKRKSAIALRPVAAREPADLRREVAAPPAAR